MASVEKVIQDALVAVLQSAAPDLSIDARDVQIWRWLPEQAFSQKDLPVIVVERPQQRGKEPFDNVTDREEYVSSISLIDSFKPKDAGIDEARERLDRLRAKVEAALWGTPYLGLEELDVMPGFWTFVKSAGEVETFVGNNLMRVRCELTVPVLIVER